jgi:sec-independent protein translocase protein TatA
MSLAGIGPAEILLVLIVALLVFGPTKLPEIAKDMGKAIRKWRKALEEIQEVTEVSVLEPPTSPQKEAELQASAQRVVGHTAKKDTDGDEQAPSDDK